MTMKTILMVICLIASSLVFADDLPFNDPSRIARREAALPVAKAQLIKNEAAEKKQRADEAALCAEDEDGAWAVQKAKDPSMTDEEVRQYVIQHDGFIAACIQFYHFTP